MAHPIGNAWMRMVLLMAWSACATSSTVEDASVNPFDAGVSDSAWTDVAALDGGPTAASERCATPQVLTFIDGEVSAHGDTSSATDEFSALECQSQGTAGPLSGPQHYYVVSVRSGATYSFVLNATFHSVLVGFDGRVGCSSEELQSACQSEGASGFASGLINPGTGGPNPGVVFAVPPDFTPAEDMQLVLVVESDGGSGVYELTVQENSR